MGGCVAKLSSLDRKISNLPPLTSVLYQLLRFRRLIRYPYLEELLLLGTKISNITGICFTLDSPGESSINYLIPFDHSFHVVFRLCCDEIRKDTRLYHALAKAVSLSVSLVQSQKGTPSMNKLETIQVVKKSRNYEAIYRLCDGSRDVQNGYRDTEDNGDIR
jgi:hypothetical protein